MGLWRLWPHHSGNGLPLPPWPLFWARLSGHAVAARGSRPSAVGRTCSALARRSCGAPCIAWRLPLPRPRPAARAQSRIGQGRTEPARGPGPSRAPVQGPNKPRRAGPRLRPSPRALPAGADGRLSPIAPQHSRHPRRRAGCGGEDLVRLEADRAAGPSGRCRLKPAAILRCTMAFGARRLESGTDHRAAGDEPRQCGQRSR